MEVATPTTKMPDMGIVPMTDSEQVTFEPHNGALFMPSNRYEKLVTPTDELTGMPLPVLHSETIPRIYTGEEYNWHHHYHPSIDKSLKGVKGLAVRHVRLQLLPVEKHNHYHHIFEGPNLPRSNQERFGHIVLACAGYIPSKAIDVYKDDPTEPVHLSKALRRRLQTGGEMQLRGTSNIAQFMRKHLISQDFSHVNDLLIDEFIHTKDIERKHFLGHWLLAIASEIAVEPIKPIYRQAMDDGLLAEPKPKLQNLVKSQINGRKTSKKAILSLRQSLISRGSKSLQTELATV